MRDQLRGALRRYLADPAQPIKSLTWKFPSTVSDQRYIFVMGCAGSGATLLRKILAVHPQCFYVNNKTELLGSTEIFSKRWIGLPHAEITRLFANSRDMVDFFDHLVEVLQDSSAPRIFVEKVSHCLHKVDFLVRHFPNSQFVHIVRDGRDGYLSSKGRPNASRTSSVSTYAKHWKRCLAKWSYSKSHPGCYELRYESLVLNPAEEISSLCSFLGLPFHPEMVDPAVIHSNRGSGRSSSRTPRELIGSSSVMRWRSEMSLRELRKFNRVAFSELSARNYALDRSA